VGAAQQPAHQQGIVFIIIDHQDPDYRFVHASLRPRRRAAGPFHNFKMDGTSCLMASPPGPLLPRQHHDKSRALAGPAARGN
jgi:hypothetical protein